MYPVVKKVDTERGEVICKDLTYGFIVGVESGEIEDSKHAVVENGTDLTMDDIMQLRKSEIDLISQTILQLTYPHLYNEDGSLKELSDFEKDADNSKKKA
jgi:hypothetical protein